MAVPRKKLLQQFRIAVYWLPSGSVLALMERLHSSSPAIRRSQEMPIHSVSKGSNASCCASFGRLIGPALYMLISICAHMYKHTPIGACVNAGHIMHDVKDTVLHREPYSDLLHSDIYARAHRCCDRKRAMHRVFEEFLHECFVLALSLCPQGLGFLHQYVIVT